MNGELKTNKHEMDINKRKRKLISAVRTPDYTFFTACLIPAYPYTVNVCNV